jgi:uncharacterized protein (TIGR03000 family)
MNRTWISVCLSVAGLATLMLPSAAEACGRRNRGSQCCSSAVAAPVSTGCCGSAYAGSYHHHHAYASTYSGGCNSCGTASTYSSGCNSCGSASAYSPSYGSGVYSAGVYSGSTWSGGACSNCGPSTVYSGQPTTVGMTNGGMIQQTGYATNGAGTVVLTVPENAEVMWGGQPVYGSGTTRRFVTLPIQGNNGAQQFQVRWMGPNGQWVTRNQTINATAGQAVNYDFTNPNAAASGQAGGQFGTEEAQPNQNIQNPNQPSSGTDINPNTPRKLPNTTPGSGNNQNNNPGNRNNNNNNNNNNQNNNPGSSDSSSNSTIGSGSSGTTGSGTTGNSNNNNNRKNRDDNKETPRD